MHCNPAGFGGDWRLAHGGQRPRSRHEKPHRFGKGGHALTDGNRRASGGDGNYVRMSACWQVMIGAREHVIRNMHTGDYVFVGIYPPDRYVVRSLGSLLQYAMLPTVLLLAIRSQAWQPVPRLEAPE